MNKSTLDKKGLIHWIDSRLPIFSTLKAFLVDYQTPKNLNFAWNFGSLLGVTLVIMIFSGIFLAMHYVADPDIAFKSVERIMRDVPYGWLIRYIHMNGASMFFILTYLHIFRGLYYGSYRKPRELLWIFGVIIFLVMMATAFMGYVLPWGQMSYWGATVITNLFTAIPFVGDQILEWLLGGFAVGAPTLNRFFALHYLLPFGLVALVLLHILSLHQFGSNNPLGISVKTEKDTIPFHPYYTYKDLFGLGLFFLFFSIFIFFFPNFFGEPDNYIPANPLVTPPHIVPEWYFLPFYAILRSIPNKLGGVIAMFGSIFVLFLLPWLDRGKVASAKFRPYFRVAFWLFVINSFILGWVGSKPAENPYVVIGQLSTFFYFGFFFMIIPLLSYFERPCVLPNSIHEYVTNKGRKG